MEHILINRPATINITRLTWGQTRRESRHKMNTEEQRKELSGEDIWSGIRESNSRLHLGKVAYYHYTNPARMSSAIPDYL